MQEEEVENGEALDQRSEKMQKKENVELTETRQMIERIEFENTMI